MTPTEDTDLPPLNGPIFLYFTSSKTEDKSCVKEKGLVKIADSKSSFFMIVFVFVSLNL